MEQEIQEVARAHHRDNPKGPSVERIVDWMGALIPRVMFPGSLAAAARLAGAEPLWTGRSRAYAESTLRLAAGRLDAEGASTHVARAVWRQVTGAVAMADEEVIAHTDMFDQPYYTKKFAHAAPIGRLGNRILACAYFGLTTISIPGGPTLFVHLSCRCSRELTGVCSPEWTQRVRRRGGPYSRVWTQQVLFLGNACEES